MQTDRLQNIVASGFAVLFSSTLLIACAATPPTPAQGAAGRPAASSSAPLAQAGSSAPAASSAPRAASAPAATPANPNLRPFNDLVRDYRKLDGLLPLWTREERYLLELRESDLDKPFYFMSHRSQGLGERWQWPGLLQGTAIVMFRRVPGDRIQWIERNTRFIAGDNKVMSLNLAQSFTDSLLGVAPVLSQPHPTSKSVLIDVSQFILNDVAAAGAQLEAAYRAPYGFDRNNSLITRVRNNAQETTFEVRLQFGLGRSPVQQPGQPAFSLPANVPDPRSISLGYHYSFSELPAAPMRPRQADPRVGYFFDTIEDFSNDLADRPRTHHIARWRLEKKDEGAALSEPKTPITFWIDRTVPERYRETVREGILMWNEAFERIGFKDAIVVKQQPDDADFSTLSRQYASVRWYVATDGGAAIGPSARDLRTGEILDADVMISDVFTRGARQTILNDIPPTSLLPWSRPHEACDFAQASAEQLHDTLDHLIARGDIRPDSPETEAYVQDYLRLTVAHEIGHALGLSHNFIASSAFTPEQLRDPAFVAANGSSASVMDYVPGNLGLTGETPVPYFQKRIGAYDLWAIEYGYKPLPADQEASALREIAERVRSDRRLAYANDVDADLGGTGSGMDPDVNRFDLGADSQAWFERRARIVQERIDWVARRSPDGWRYNLARDTVERSLLGLAGSARTLAKKIGGLRGSHDASTVTPSLIPVPAAEQRRALDSLNRHLFRPDSLRLPPELLTRLPIDHVERFGGTQRNRSPYLPMVELILNTQVSVIDALMSDVTTLRLLNSELLRRSPQDSLSIAELLSSLQQNIWSELDKPGQNIELTRRNLQRAWSNRLVGWVARMGQTNIPDVRSLARAEAEALRGRLQNALKSRNYNAESRAHLQETLNMIDEALRATLIKLG